MTEYMVDTSGWAAFSEALKQHSRKYSPPSWVGPHWTPIPSPFRKCVWCKEHLSIFGSPSIDLGDGWAHGECVDKAERFALKSSIRNRTNPNTGYFPGWRTP